MMAFFAGLSTATVWMLIGTVMILLEVMMIPTMALLFAGLGAVTLGGLMAYEVVTNENFFLQLAYWFAFTIVWATVLWVPLKKRRAKKSAGYSDMVGSQATVIGKELIKGKSGKVNWSGAAMKARLSDNAQTHSIDVGQEVTIEKVEGGVLYVVSAE